MFNKDFYPTPKCVLDAILGSLDFKDKIILEPSAGNGNIVDYLNEKGAKEVLTCEINDQLATIVKTKSRFIAEDFLTVSSDKISHIDYVIMNPPFSADEKHILHAWEIAPEGCQIYSLCNWETLNNDFSRSRKQLNTLISDYGRKENLGPVFDDAERRTGAEIGFVCLIKPGIKQDFSDYFISEDDEPESQENGIMSYNAVREVVQRYVNAIKLYDDVCLNAVKMSSLISPFNDKYSGEITFTCYEGEVQKNKETFQKELQKKCWKWIFNKLDMGKFVTRGVQDDINKFVEQQKDVKFTMRNIYKMLEVVISTASQRMDKAMLEVFDKLTMNYHENRYNLPGWKTNSHYLVNKKFIFNGICYQDQRWYKGESKIQMYSSDSDKVEDLSKALCFLTGTDYKSFPNLYEEVRKPINVYGEWFDWGFFKCKAFKKGTMHFIFKDENVWALFNQNIARIKGYPLFENNKQEDNKRKEKSEKVRQNTEPKKANVLFEITI